MAIAGDRSNVLKVKYNKTTLLGRRRAIEELLIELTQLHTSHEVRDRELALLDGSLFGKQEFV